MLPSTMPLMICWMKVSVVDCSAITSSVDLDVSSNKVEDVSVVHAVASGSPGPFVLEPLSSVVEGKAGVVGVVCGR